MWETSIFDIWEKEMATHSSILAWKIPRTEEPGGLQSVMSHDQSTHAWGVGERWVASNKQVELKKIKIDIWKFVLVKQKPM